MQRITDVSIVRTVTELVDALSNQNPVAIRFDPTVEIEDDEQLIRLIENSLSRASTLKSLWLRLTGAALLSAMLRAVFQNDQLQELELNRCNITDEVARVFQDAASNHELSSLKRLSVRYSNLSSKNGALLLGTLQSIPSLVHLDLYQTGLGDSKANMNCLATFLKENRTVKELELDYCVIHHKQFKKVAVSSGENPVLEVLSMAENILEDTGIRYLCDGMTNQSVLTSLNLSSTVIGSMGAKAIGLYLSTNRSLRKLFLNYNHIEDEGFASIVDGLGKNETLLELFAMRTGLSNASLEHLSRLFIANLSLVTVNLSDNFRLGAIEEETEVIEQLLENLDKNPVLTRFEVTTYAPIRERISPILLRNRKNKEAVFNSVVSDRNVVAPWKKCKVMIIGEGRAGKTALLRSFMGEDFLFLSPSTVGADVHELAIDLREEEQADWYERSSEGISHVRKFATAVTKEALFDLNMKTSPTFRQKHHGSKLEEDETTKTGESLKEASAEEIVSTGVMETEQKVKHQNNKNLVLKTAPSRARRTEKSVHIKQRKKSQILMKKPGHKAGSAQGLAEVDAFNETLLETSNEHSFEYTLWDLGGQDVFFSLHQLFLTEMSLFLVVFDLSKVAELLKKMKQGFKRATRRSDRFGGGVSFLPTGTSFNLRSPVRHLVNQRFLSASKSPAFAAHRTEPATILMSEDENLVEQLCATGEDFAVYDHPANQRLIESSEVVQNLIFWLRSVALFCKTHRVLLVGTMLDKFRNTNRLLKVSSFLAYLMKKYELQELSFVFHRSVLLKTPASLMFFPVSNQAGTGIPALKQSVKQVTKEKFRSLWSQLIPMKHMHCLDALLRFHKQGNSKSVNENYVRFHDFEKLCKPFGVVDREEMQDILRLFNNRGIITYFSSCTGLKELIIIRPQWLLDCVSTIIRDPDAHFDNLSSFAGLLAQVQQAGLAGDSQKWQTLGVVSHDLCSYLLKGNRSLQIGSEEEVKFVLDVMENVLLLAPIEAEELKTTYLVPSMLPLLSTTQRKEQPVEFYDTLRADGHGCKLVFNKNPDGYINYLPKGVFEKLLCLLIGLLSQTFPSAGVESQVVYRNLGVLRLGDGPKSGASDRFLLEYMGGDELLLYANIDALSSLSLVDSFLTKLQQEFVGPTFAWKVQFLAPAAESAGGDLQKNPMTIAEAKHQLIQPWFSASVKRDLGTIDVGTFLSM